MEEHPETEARMVDVTTKDVTHREAEAIGLVRMSEETRGRVLARKLDKGDALEVARIAGIMAAKRTSELIPLCHPISIGAITIDLVSADNGIEITAVVKTTERTGVEMEALTAVAVAALTVYDMIKGIDRGAAIESIRLVRKSGGRSGDWIAQS